MMFTIVRALMFEVDIMQEQIENELEKWIFLKK